MANLIFDYDGTLHESIHIYAPAFRKAQEYLMGKNLVNPYCYTDKEISRWLGFTAKEMWDTFAPQLLQSEKDICSKIIGDEMIRLTSRGNARLYENALPILKELKGQGHTLLLLSNCKTNYLNAHIEYFNLDDYFTDLYASEQYNFIPKFEIFSVIKAKYTGEFIIIGDRFQDVEIASFHGLKSIGCVYGYGDSQELKAATHLVDNINQVISRIL